MGQYQKIDERITRHGVWELWENIVYGNEYAFIVKLNGLFHGYTWEDLTAYLIDEGYIEA